MRDLNVPPVVDVLAVLGIIIVFWSVVGICAYWILRGLGWL